MLLKDIFLSWSDVFMSDFVKLCLNTHVTPHSKTHAHVGTNRAKKDTQEKHNEMARVAILSRSTIVIFS